MSGRNNRQPWRPPSAPQLPLNRLRRNRHQRSLQRSVNRQATRFLPVFFQNLSQLRLAWRTALYLQDQIRQLTPAIAPRSIAERIALRRELQPLRDELNQQLENVNILQNTLDQGYQGIQNTQHMLNQEYNQMNSLEGIPRSHRRPLYFHDNPAGDMNIRPEYINFLRRSMTNATTPNIDPTQAEHRAQVRQAFTNRNMSPNTLQTSLAPTNWYQAALQAAQNPPEYGTFSGQPPAA